MALKLYLIKGYAENKVPYTKAEIFFGGIIDIVTWPVVLLAHIIINGRR